MHNQKVAPSNFLLPLIEESYRAEYAEWSRRNLRYSDAGAGAQDGQKCERAIYYDMTQGDQKSTLTTGSLVLFDDGRLHESDIRRRLRTILRSPEKEVTDPDTGARGKLDNTVYKNQIDPKLPEDPGLEIKSANHFSFVEMAANGTIDQGYYDQIQLYLASTGKPFFIVLIKNRNSLGADKGQIPFLEFQVFPDPDRQKELKAGLMATKQSVEQKVIPPRPFLRDSTQCSFCRFKHICWDPVEAVEQKIEQQQETGDVDPKVFEAALKTYVDIRRQMNELDSLKEGALEVIARHFKATGKDKEIIGNIKASFSPRYTSVLDAEYLKSRLTRDQMIAISLPKAELLEALVKDRQIDASILDEAIKKIAAGQTVRVSEIKMESPRQTTLTKGGQDGQAAPTNSTAGKKRAPGRAHGKPGKRGPSAGPDKSPLQRTPEAQQ